MPGSRLAVLAVLAVLLTLLPARAATQDLRWSPGSGFTTYCADATRPDTTLLSTFGSIDGALPPGSYAFNWATGERSRMAEVAFETCNPANGLLYGGLPRSEATGLGEVVLFSSSSPRPVVIDRMPTHFALDGSLWVYTLKTWPLDAPAELWASPDGGRSWLRRALPTQEPRSWLTCPSSNVDKPVAVVWPNELIK